MAFCIEKDMGTGNPPAFFGGISRGNAKWVTLGPDVATFPTEAQAQFVIDEYDVLMGCIVQEYDETVDLSNKSYPKNKL